MFNKNNKSVTKKVPSKDGIAPELALSIKQVSPKKFQISIIHPNTKSELYCKTHIAQSLNEAFELGRSIKKAKFSNTKTWYEETLHIPRPKRGKMKLKTKEENEEDISNFDKED